MSMSTFTFEENRGMLPCKTLEELQVSKKRGKKSLIAPISVQVETAIDEVVDDAVNAILEEEDAEKVVEELKELEEKVVDAAAATITEETLESAQQLRLAFLLKRLAQRFSKDMIGFSKVHFLYRLLKFKHVLPKKEERQFNLP